MRIPNIFMPNAKVPASTSWMLLGGWVVASLLFWWTVLPHVSALVPTPPEVAGAALQQWQYGAVTQLFASITISLSAIFFALTLGLSLSYLSTVPFFKAPVNFIGSARVVSLTGITFIFVLATPNGYWLKVSVLTFAIIVFLVNNMMTVINDIPQAKFDYARTLGLTQWQVTREVVIRGTLPSAFDSLRMNAAMAWMMLTMVEGISRSGGGIGIVLIELARQSNFAAIFAVQAMIFIVGIGQDNLIKYAKLAACPYTKDQ